MVLGSVTNRLLAISERPVLVVRDLLEFIPCSCRHAEQFKVSMNQPMTGMYIDRDSRVLANGLCGTDLHLHYVALSAMAVQRMYAPLPCAQAGSLSSSDLAPGQRFEL